MSTRASARGAADRRGEASFLGDDYLRNAGVGEEDARVSAAPRSRSWPGNR